MVNEKNPLIVVNFKNHKVGKDVLNLSKIIQKKYPEAIVCVPSVNIFEISKNTKLNVFAQHINDKDDGSTTGFVTVESIKSVGAKGTLLNHSEHKLPFSVLHNLIKRCNEKNLKAIVCLESLSDVKWILRQHHKPYAIAYEDVKLIGSGKSVTTYNPRNIKKFIKIMKHHPGIIPLCGAGISNWKDVKEAQKLGCKGVLVATAITKAKNPEKFFKD